MATDTTGTTLVTLTYIPDTTPPTASPSVSPARNSFGWNNTDVTVNWNWTDNGAGLDSANCTTSSASSGEGVQTLTATCKDLAGNVGSASYVVQVDKTSPTNTAQAVYLDTTTPYVAGTWTNQSVLVSSRCAD